MTNLGLVHLMVPVQVDLVVDSKVSISLIWVLMIYYLKSLEVVFHLDLVEDRLEVVEDELEDLIWK